MNSKSVENVGITEITVLGKLLVLVATGAPRHLEKPVESVLESWVVSTGKILLNHGTRWELEQVDDRLVLVKVNGAVVIGIDLIEDQAGKAGVTRWRSSEGLVESQELLKGDLSVLAEELDDELGEAPELALPSG